MGELSPMRERRDAAAMGRVQEEIQVGLPHVHRGAAEHPAPVPVDQPPAVVGVHMGEEDVVDLVRAVAGGAQAAHQFAARSRAEEGPCPGVDQRQLRS